MGIVSGGKVIESTGGSMSVGTRGAVYYVEAVPTDANVGAPAFNGMIAQNVLTGNIYERQAGVWVRIDTL